MNKKMDVIENNIAHQALHELEDATGIKGKWEANRLEKAPSGKITFSLPNGKQKFFVEVKKTLRKHQIDQLLLLNAKHEHFLLVAAELFPNVKKILRQHQIGYLDSAGNIYLNSDGQLIWIEGKKNNKETKQVTNRAFTKTGLKVLFYLLIKEHALQLTHRMIANNANVALGNISLVLAGLKEASFLLPLNEKENIWQNKSELLQRWIEGYRETLKPTLHQGNFRFDKTANVNWQDLKLKNGDVWGGEAAGSLVINYLNPSQLTIYTDMPKIELMKDLRLIPDTNGQIQIYQKFWKEDLNASNDIAPYLLIYADLILTEDPRCIETAKLIYDKYLKKIMANEQ